jgi:biotin-dependent carboxylase-like uncharacterized protein
MMILQIQRAPPGTSIQDAGRFGYMRYGVSPGGPMDWARHAMANSMLGKSPKEPAIEIGPAGIGIGLNEGEIQLSFSGPGFCIKLDKHVFTGPARFLLKAGQSLEIIPRQGGAMWGYLGVQGSLNIPPLLGSYAQNSVSGLHALKLVTGVNLSITASSLLSPSSQSYIDPYIALEKQSIRIIPSSQSDNFSATTRDSLAQAALSIAPRYDRMAYQLKGIELICDSGHDILSDGVTLGAIQVPGDGRPYVLMADHQSTGGYPKIACICHADLPRMAQMQPGRHFSMEWISVDEALLYWADIRQQIGSMTALRGITH